MDSSAHGHSGNKPICTARRQLLALAMGTGLTAVAGCASTQLVTTWTLPGYAGPPMRKLMVIAISRASAPRRVFELAFAQELRLAGAQAIPSHERVASDGVEDPAVFVQAVRESGVDGILVSRFVANEQVTVRDPFIMDPVSLGSFNRRFPSVWVKVYEPRVYEKVITLGETSIYRASDGAMVWSAITEAPRPVDLESATRDFAGVAIAGLRRQGILKRDEK